MSCISDGEARLWRDLQELVRRTGLMSGSLSITLHDGKARKLKLKAEVVLAVSVPGMLPISTDNETDWFVQDRLEKPLVELIGLYGHADVFVEGGIAKYLELCVRKKLAL